MAITARSLAMGTLAMSHPWHVLRIVLVTLSLATSSVPSAACADVLPREFRPGPHVPEGVEPKRRVDASGLDLSVSTFIGMDLDSHSPSLAAGGRLHLPASRIMPSQPGGAVRLCWAM